MSMFKSSALTRSLKHCGRRILPGLKNSENIVYARTRRGREVGCSIPSEVKSKSRLLRLHKLSRLPRSQLPPPPTLFSTHFPLNINQHLNT
ncbi:uncharacterized protein LAJ45_00616 [Morchella importuna]|uniref:uncharacterized protein n=1 Tax=Morchella importuna TaxID=1174673 RepID=UPI001E8E1560|nr:uncharacterized protein LAJ45_00616 [Morchella importuna]KAH8155606.1 hypothetical protein LAJ45_00616 [Morchella importuna]